MVDTAPIPVNPFKPQTDAPAPPTENPMSPFGSMSDDENFSIDLTNAQAGGSITPATYLLRVADVERDTAKSSGNPMIVWTFEIVADSSAKPTEYAGRSIKRYCALTPTALFSLVQTVEALGLGKGGTEVNWTKRDAIDRMCWGVITNTENDGRKNNNLQETIALPTPGQKYAKAL